MAYWFSPGRNGLGIVPITLSGWIAVLVLALSVACTFWLGTDYAQGVLGWALLLGAVAAEGALFIVLILFTLRTGPRP